MANIDHKTERLAELAPFAGASRRALKRIAALADETDVPAGTHLSEQDGFAAEAFIVMEGTVTIERDGEEVARIGPGTVVGEVALLDHTRRNATLVASTPVHLFVFAVREFESLLEEFPGVAERIREDASTRRAPGAASG
jgi:CRP/FNR family transcriptional regulator, cyclic AMP receptor protein